MWQARSENRVFLVSTLGLVVLAWLSILAWGASPYGDYLHHEALAHIDDPLSAEFIRRAGVFLIGWSLMIIAMMLPTTLPLASLFHAMTRTRSDSTELVVILFAGYVVAWGLFGITAYTSDLAIHESVTAVPWLNTRAWLVTVAILLAAGVYQFTPLKYYCLDKCRSPYAFIVGQWHGSNPRVEALLLGARHGMFCVGCCWSIMLVLFGLGMGNAAWMVLVAVAMAIEKNFWWGSQLTPALGTVLLSAGITLLVLGGPATACAC